MGTGRSWIGCSGWLYAHWRGDFYPADLPPSGYLEHYSRVFQTVEVNSTFYRLPPADTFRRWRAGTPEGFLFAVKASRYLTHQKKLQDPEEPLRRLLSGAGKLEEKLGPILYQLPPNWSADPGRLRAFLGVLPADLRHVLELRDRSWYRPEILDALRAHGVALCLGPHAHLGLNSHGGGA